jgi:predicted ATPase/DNA-binding XRE family transcriptional regulator
VSNFAQWVKDRRKALDLTQAELAERVGCSLITVAKIESGERRPSKQIAELMATHLDIASEQRDAFISFARGQTDVPPWSGETGKARAQRATSFTGIPAAAIIGKLIGRERELAELTTWLQDDSVHLITLVGPGGVGKTQLALHAVHAARDHFAHGICFVDASTCRDAIQLTRALARALGAGAGELNDEDMLTGTLRHIANLNVLLALDNLEQIVDAPNVVAEVLANCPRVWLICTSRAALGLNGERVLTLQPLPIPITVRGEGASTSDLMRIPSVMLFVERARKADANFQLTSGNSRAVAELCQRLDGLPLALELAAARVGLMSPQALLTKLAPAQRTNIGLIASGDLATPARQRTLHNAIQWSYDLLTPDEQSVFRQLGVFVGGFTLAAAEAVLRTDTASPETNAMAVWDAISAQLSRTLLQRRDAAAVDEEVRFVQLETIREFAVQQLDACVEVADVRRRHAGYFLDFVAAAAALLHGPQLTTGLSQIDSDYANIRAALDWLLHHDASLAQKLAVRLFPYWEVRGYFREGRIIFERCLAQHIEPTEDRAKALLGLAIFEYHASHLDSALAHCDEALALCQRFHDKRGIAQALMVNAWVAESKHNAVLAKSQFEDALTSAREAGDDYILARVHITYALLLQSRLSDHAAADASLDEALTIYRRVGDFRGVAHTLMQRSEVLAMSGDYSGAIRLARESAQTFRTLGATNELGWALTSLGESSLNAGVLADAKPAVEESQALFEQVGVLWGVAINLHHLGRIALREGDIPAARSCFLRSLALCQQLDRPAMIARCLVGLAGVALQQRDFARAASVLNAARPHLPYNLTPADIAEVDSYMDAAQAGLADSFVAEVLTLAQAVTLAG